MLKASPFITSRCFPPAFLYLHSSKRALFRSKYTPSLPPFSASARYSSFAHTAHKMESESFRFGPYKIDPKGVFYSTQSSRGVKRFIDLTAEETSDLWLTAQKIGRQLESYHKASSLTLVIQDGPQAGQTVPHVHIHILPRKGGDFEKNDEIYDAIDAKEKELKEKLDLDLDKERKDRSMNEMAKEADQYRKLFI